MAGPAAALLLLLVPGVAPATANVIGGILTQIVPPIIGQLLTPPQAPQGCICQTPGFAAVTPRPRPPPKIPLASRPRK